MLERVKSLLGTASMYGRRPCLRLELKSSRTLDDSGSGESHSGGAVVPEGAWHSSRDTRKIKMGESSSYFSCSNIFLSCVRLLYMGKSLQPFVHNKQYRMCRM